MLSINFSVEQMLKRVNYFRWLLVLNVISGITVREWKKKRLILGSCIPPEGAPIRLQLGNTDPLSALVLAYTKTIYLICINQTTFSILTKQSK